MLLTAASGCIPGIPPLEMYAMDVSQAFTNSPLPKGAHICVKKPLSVSTPKADPVFLEEYNGLNGLRIASLAWAEFFERIVKQANVVTSQPFEPCLYIGRSELGFCCSVCYVDDVLMGSSSKALFQRVFDEITKCVKVRQTGFIGIKEGGSL